MGKLTSNSGNRASGGARRHSALAACFSRVGTTLLLAGLAGHAAAQSAASFGTPGSPPTSVAPAVQEPAQAPAKEALPVSTVPSRLIGPEEKESYLVTISSVFSAGARTLDPFGQLQDPDAKPIVKATTPKAARRAAVQVTPFSDIVGLIEITTIMPGENRFLIGTRSIALGDQLPLAFRGKQIRTQITEVSSREIRFRNLDTGEIASRKLDLLPTGMTPGSRGMTPPGMVKDRPDAPILLDASDPTP